VAIAVLVAPLEGYRGVDSPQVGSLSIVVFTGLVGFGREGFAIRFIVELEVEPQAFECC
jgi:hypothetical protein